MLALLLLLLLKTSNIFELFRVETRGLWGSNTRAIFKELIDNSRGQKFGLFLAQRISFAIQLGNAARLSGTLPVGDDAADLF